MRRDWTKARLWLYSELQEQSLTVMELWSTSLREEPGSLRGELDTIARTAMRDDPARRYATADQLTDDIRRYLAGLPITARPDTWTYRARKYVTRRPGVVAAMVIAILVAGGYAVTLTRYAERLESERARALTEATIAQQVSDFLVDLFDPGDFRVAGRDTITARHLVERSAANIAEALHDQPFVRSALAGALGRIHVSLGLHDEAEDLLAEALELQRTHGSGAELADALYNYASALRANRSFDRAEPLLREALAIRRADPQTHPVQLASALSALALTWGDLGKADSAEVLITEVLALRRQAQVEAHPAYLKDLANLAFIRRRRGDLEGAEALYREVLARLETSGSRIDPTIYNNLAYILVQRGEFAEAESFYRAALEIHGEVYGDVHRTTSLIRSNLAGALEDQEKFDEAELVWREHVEILQAHLEPDHWRIATSIAGLGRFFTRRGDHARAEPLLRESADLLARSLGSEHPWTNRDRARLAGALISLDRLDEAEALLMHARAELGPSETAQGREAHNAILEALDRLAETRNPGS